eukprot:tig00000796_g4229.t1
MLSAWCSCFSLDTRLPDDGPTLDALPPKHGPMPPTNRGLAGEDELFGDGVLAIKRLFLYTTQFGAPERREL